MKRPEVRCSGQAAVGSYALDELKPIVIRISHERQPLAALAEAVQVARGLDPCAFNAYT